MISTMRNTLRIGLLAAVVCAALGAPAVAQADCNAEQTIFFNSTAAGSVTSTGNQQELRFNHANTTDSTCLSHATIHHSSTHIRSQSPNWTEVIAEEYKTSTSHDYRLSTEGGTNFQTTFHDYFHDTDLPSNCSDLSFHDLSWVLVKVVLSGTSWRGYLDCDPTSSGFDWYQLGAAWSTGFTTGQAMVEAGRFGTSSPEDNHRTMQYRRSDLTWSNTFVSLECYQDNISGWRGDLDSMTGSYFQTETGSDNYQCGP
jgi:hypothetical protein